MSSLQLTKYEMVHLIEVLQEDLLGCRLELEADPDNDEASDRLDEGRYILGKFAEHIIEQSCEEQKSLIYESSDLATRPELN